MENNCRFIILILSTLTLTGCFQPLYSEANHPKLVAAMRQIQVSPIPDRIGHYLANDLMANLNGSGENFTPKYRLDVKISQNSKTPTVASQINTADAATVIGTANFDLVEIENSKSLYHGVATSAAVYDRSLQSFANLRAGRDAEIRIARALADEIELRVAAALAVVP